MFLAVASGRWHHGRMALTSEYEAHHLRKLAALVTQRRIALGIRSKLKAAQYCGIADYTYRRVEKGEGVSKSTYAQLDVGFGFRAGSCSKVAQGLADSIILEDGTELIEGGQVRDFVDPERLKEAFDRAFDKSAQLTAPNLTLSQAKAMKDEMFKELMEDGTLN